MAFWPKRGGANTTKSRALSARRRKQPASGSFARSSSEAKPAQPAGASAGCSAHYPRARLSKPGSLHFSGSSNMASLRDQIQADLTDAMRKKEETRKTALRMLISAIRNAEI